LPTYGVIYLAMTCLQNYLIYWWCKRVVPEAKISIRHFRRNKVREILSFSAHTTVSRISSLLYYHTANILVNIFWGPAFNTIYAVSLKLPMLMRRIFTEATWTLTSTFTDLYAKKDRKRFELLFFMYSKLVSIVATPLSLVLIFMAGPIISLWVGSGFKLASDIMPIHMLPLLLTIPLAACACVVSAYAKVKVPSRVSFAISILNVILIIILGKVFSLGLVGVAIAMAISVLLSIALFTSYYACRITGISVGKYWIESFVKPIGLAGLIMGGGFLSIFMIWSELRLSPASVLILGLAIIIYYLSAYRFVLNPVERSHVNEIFDLVFNKPRALWVNNDES